MHVPQPNEADPDGDARFVRRFGVVTGVVFSNSSDRSQNASHSVCFMYGLYVHLRNQTAPLGTRLRPRPRPRPRPRRRAETRRHACLTADAHHVTWTQSSKHNSIGSVSRQQSERVRVACDG
eukprot:6842604-Prymnesium_polylepis.1